MNRLFFDSKITYPQVSSKGARKYIINPHTSLPIFQLSTQRQNTPVSTQSIGAFCAEYDRFILFTAYKGHTQSQTYNHSEIVITGLGW